jgi:hypothetical protein
VSPAGSKGVLIGGVVVIAVVVTAVVMLRGGGAPGPVAQAGEASDAPSTTTPNSAAQRYLQDFAAGDANGVGLLTDAPQAASAALLDAWQSSRW